MKVFDSVIFIQILIFCFSLNSFSFPEILSWKKAPTVMFDNKKQALLKKNVLLKSPFVIVTAHQDQLEFKINLFDRVVVYPKTKIQVLEFMDESGFVPDLYILDGQIRFLSGFRTVTNGAQKNDLSVQLKTPFFDLKVNGVVDFIIDLKMAEPSIEVKVIEGLLPLEFFSYEKKLILKAGESVKFQGILADEGGAIKYDYLLHQRKAPKGVLGEVQKFDGRQFIKAEKDLLRLEANKKREVKLKNAEKQRKQKKLEDSFLCQKPFAQRDQCAWWLEAGKCYRKRCNVSGKWGDQVERPITDICKNDFFVTVCDY